MARQRHRPEQIITKLCEADVALAQGQTVAQVCEAICVPMAEDLRRGRRSDADTGIRADGSTDVLEAFSDPRLMT